ATYLSRLWRSSPCCICVATHFSHLVLVHVLYFLSYPTVAATRPLKIRQAEKSCSLTFVFCPLPIAYCLFALCPLPFAQITIFSIGTTNIPCAPADCSCSIFSQNSSSLNTLCTLLQPDSASGNTVGLFIPGNSEMISFSLSFGAFSKMYLLRLAFFTARMRNRSLPSISSWNSSRFLLFISIAC